jgi:hypothetical protein
MALTLRIAVVVTACMVTSLAMTAPGLQPAGGRTALATGTWAITGADRHHHAR